MSDSVALPTVPLPDPAEPPPAMMIDTEIVGFIERGAGVSGGDARINKLEE